MPTPPLSETASRFRDRRSPIKKRRRSAAFETVSESSLRRLGCLFLHRARILALGIDVAVDEFDHGHGCVVAVAEAGLDDAGVAALAVLVAGGQNVEQFPGLVEIAHLGDRLPAHRKTALLAERDQLLHDR